MKPTDTDAHLLQATMFKHSFCNPQDLK